MIELPPVAASSVGEYRAITTPEPPVPNPAPAASLPAPPPPEPVFAVPATSVCAE